VRQAQYEADKAKLRLEIAELRVTGKAAVVELPAVRRVQ
jgi:hypothetical protein